MSSYASRFIRLPQIGFIGCGKLAEALTKGFIAAGVVQLHEIHASAPTEREIYWVKQLGCQTTTDNIKLVKDNPLIVLAVKPQVLPKVLREISPFINKDHLLISFAAGMKYLKINIMVICSLKLNKNQELFFQKRTYNNYKYHKGINTISKSTQNHTKLPHTSQT